MTAPPSACPVPAADASAAPSPDTRLVMVVQRPSTGNSLQARLLQGHVQVADTLRVAATGQTSTVHALSVQEDTLQLTLDSALAVSAGDVLSLAHTPLEMADQFEVLLHWHAQEPGLVGRRYLCRLAGQTVPMSVTALKHRIDADTQLPLAAPTLQTASRNVCTVASTRPVAFAPVSQSAVLGRFTLHDSDSGALLATGEIRHSLWRAANVQRQNLSITRAQREQQNGHKGRVIWFTGLSGSGKSTIANALEVQLHAAGQRTYLLDGDNVRQGLNKDLGFTEADRVENIRRIAEVAKLMLDAGLVVMTAFISPFRRERDMARELIGAAHFMEIYVATPLPVCEQRDVKGLYKKARAGQIKNMTGISSPYEAPEHPDLILDTSQASVEDLAAQVASQLQAQAAA